MLTILEIENGWLRNIGWCLQVYLGSHDAVSIPEVPMGINVFLPHKSFWW